MSQENETVRDQTSLLTRRTVVRTAAWAVPAITVVTAAPAMAVSTHTIAWASGAPSGVVSNGQKTITLNASVVVTASPAATDNVSLVINFPSTAGSSITVTTAPVGWTGPTTGSTITNLQATYTASIPGTSTGTTLAFSGVFTASGSNVKASGAYSLSVQSSGLFTPNPLAGSFTA